MSAWLADRATAELAGFALPLVMTALRATLVLALAFLLDRAFRRAPAAARHLLWVGAFAALVLLPALAPALPAVGVPLLPAWLGAPGGAGIEPAQLAGTELADPESAFPAETATRPAPAAARRLTAVPAGASSSEAAAATASPPSTSPISSTTASVVPRPPPLSVRGATGPGAPFHAAGLLAAAVVALAAAGTLLLLAYLLLGVLRAALIARSARRVDGEPGWRVLLEAAVAEHRPPRRPSLAVSDAVSVPMLCGFLRSTVLLPATAETWSDQERRRVLSHELAHAARRDGLSQVLARGVVALYWWHPLAWRALSRLVLAAELACDDRVLAAGDDGPDYARQLLELAARRRPEARTFGAPRPAAVAMARRPHLALRIRAVLDEARPRGPLPRATTSAAVAAVLLAAVVVAPVQLVAAAPGVAGGEAAGKLGAGPTAAEDRPARSGAAEAPAAADAELAGRRDPAAATGSRDWHGLDRSWVRESIASQRHRMTPLMRAVLAADRAEVRRLLDRGADPDAGVRSLGTPLILASDAGDAELVELLLDRGADPNRAETGDERPGDLQRTPLGSAARSGDLATVELLLAAGAAVDAAPRGDATPLMTASRHGFLDLAERLVEAGADVDARIVGDGTPLLEAARGGHLAVVDLLLVAGAPPDTAIVGDGNPLIAAASSGRREVLDRLLAAGADPDVWVPGDESALYHAIENGDAWMVERLIEAGADVGGHWPEEEGPLALAAQAGNRQVTELLWQAGARR